LPSSPRRTISSVRRLFDKGCCLLQQSQWAEAIRCLRQAAKGRSNDSAILHALAQAYHRNGDLLQALKVYNRLIQLQVATELTWCAVGKVLTDLDEDAQAVVAFENSLRIKNRNPEAHHNLGRVLYRLGDADRAAHHLEIALSQRDRIVSWLALATIIPGCPHATQKKILEIRKTYASKLEAGKIRSDRFEAPNRTKGRIRVGYLSAHFDSANYMEPVWGLINHHDRKAFKVYLFSDSPSENGMRGYRKNPGDEIHETSRLDNDELSALIQDTAVHVLVDLSGYSALDRLPLFLRHLAPVTLAWFNVYATSGLPGFDYIVGDEEVIGRGEEGFFSEQVLRLPLSYLTFDVTHPTPPIVAPPIVRNGYLTFGSLVSQYKITPPVLDAWAEILNRTVNTCLVLANASLDAHCNREYVFNQFIQRGVDAERIILLGRADHLTFLRYYNQIDIALDAFPYNGGTTTMEAIWQGVPVLTFDGDRWASRISTSLLRNSPLGEFVACDIREMINLAVRLAHDPATPAKLSVLRRRMRRLLKKSTVCDTVALARNMERLYRRVLTAQRSSTLHPITK
jgi:protein O-GlcNAc transferase